LVPRESNFEGNTDPKEAESVQRIWNTKDPRESVVKAPQELVSKNLRDVCSKDLKDSTPKYLKDLTSEEPKELFPRNSKELNPKYTEDQKGVISRAPKGSKEVIPKVLKETTLEGSLKRSRSELLPDRRVTEDSVTLREGHLILKHVDIGGDAGQGKATLEGALKRSRIKSLESMHISSGQGDFDDVGPTPELKGMKEELDGASRRAWEKKAVKSDDAGVPEYLWLEHLVEDGPTPWPARAVAGFPRAATLMRRVMLRWWKRKLLRSWNGVKLDQRKYGQRPRMGTSLVLTKDDTSGLIQGRLGT
jgi:hypothetical protein